MQSTNQLEDIEAIRWQLALNFLTRSQQSADQLRTLLFAIAAGSLGFVLNQIGEGGSVALHALSAISAGIALTLLVAGWQLQKRKATLRQQWFMKNRFSSYENMVDGFIRYDQEINYQHGKNFIYDWGTFLSLGLAGILELMAVLV